MKRLRGQGEKFGWVINQLVKINKFMVINMQLCLTVYNSRDILHEISPVYPRTVLSQCRLCGFQLL